MAAPANASTIDSVSSWRITRARLAPRAARTANSRAPGGAAAEQQAGDVGAGDGQHEADGAEQDQHRLAQVPDELRGERHDRRAAAAVLDGILLRQARRWLAPPGAPGRG